MKLKLIREGLTKLYVPEESLKFRGPGRAIAGFYNPLMEFSRDISVIVVNAVKPRKGLDGLAACGARGVRFANESNVEVVVNDLNKEAFKLILKNIVLNNLSNAYAENKNFNIVVNESSYDYIDIDPYGSPIPYLDSAFRVARKNSIVSITATDLAVLCGTQSKACFRKYFSLPLRTEYSKELGLRILLATCALDVAKYDKFVVPLLCYYADHYFRVYLKIGKGARKANLILKNIGYLEHDFKTAKRKILTLPKKTKYQIAGPLWLGKLFEFEFLSKLKIEDFLGTKKKVQKYLELWKEEANAHPFYFELNELARIFKVSPIKLEKIITLLKEKKFSATKTHFSPTGFKTNAGIEELKEIFLHLQHSL
ncbi:MAG: tRNA (guanine(10)-N(2))-dimethyltransferase [Candidatus Thermoplasmatota archaeon]|nr:tRNA (guanine(10)-N(2))-dimethyltransferase [Candidatus Thermoplasmatota archaeon]